MGEARRRKHQQAQGPGALPENLADLNVETQVFLGQLSAWDIDSHWQAPPAVEQEGEASEVMLYLVDTLSLWNVVGGASEKRVINLFEMAQSAPPSLFPGAPGLAGVAILNAANRGVGLGDTSCQNALTLSGFYLACTETYAVARDKGTLRGHWFVLLYHLENGNRTVRPFYAPEPARRKLNAQEHMNLIVDVIARDLHSRSSGIAERIEEGGGLKMLHGLKKRVSPTGR